MTNVIRSSLVALCSVLVLSGYQGSHQDVQQMSLATGLLIKNATITIVNGVPIVISLLFVKITNQVDQCEETLTIT